jgi:putative two-component system response regulator
MVEWGDAATVLIADESPEQVRLIIRMLAGQGYRCISASTGIDAVGLCASQRIDVVLLGIDLPDADGLSACRELKNAAETALIPILIHADARSHLAALEAGADDFLPAPIGPRELRARVRSAVRMKHLVDELDNAAASVVMLAAAIEARDPYTIGHRQRLASYAAALGRRIGLGGLDLRALEQGGYLHDIGKVAIPDAVLFKPGRLTPQEFELIKSHPIVGDRICSPLRTLSRARPVIRSHHELLDGSGYPDRLRGAAVPLLAQVIGVVDVYDALVSDRAYRKALSVDAALAVLRDEARRGKRDASLVEEFAAIVLGDADGLAAPATAFTTHIASGHAPLTATA